MVVKNFSSARQKLLRLEHENLMDHQRLNYVPFWANGNFHSASQLKSSTVSKLHVDGYHCYFSKLHTFSANRFAMPGY